MTSLKIELTRDAKRKGIAVGFTFRVTLRNAQSCNCSAADQIERTIIVGFEDPNHAASWLEYLKKQSVKQPACVHTWLKELTDVVFENPDGTSTIQGESRNDNFELHNYFVSEASAEAWC